MVPVRVPMLVAQRFNTSFPAMTRPDGFVPRVLWTASMVTRYAQAQVWASTSQSSNNNYPTWSSLASGSTASRATMNSERLMTEEGSGLSTELVIFSILFSIGATLCCLWYVCKVKTSLALTTHSHVVLRRLDFAACGNLE
jgi:hypothetical protein